MSHVPTPYRFEYKDWRGQPSIHAHIRGDEHESCDEECDEPCRSATAVAVVHGNPTSEPVTRDTAAFLCRAANSHAELLAFAKDIASNYDHEECYHRNDMADMCCRRCKAEAVIARVEAIEHPA